jgi:predicted dehydrogenase
MTPLRIGLVGCGRLAEVGYLPALGSIGTVELVALADPDPGRRARLATLAGDAGRGPVATFAGVGELLDRTAVDAVVVASPAAAHVEDAHAAAAAGVPALVEKPPATDAAGAADLAALTPAPVIGFNRRFDPAIAALRDRVPGEGDLVLDLVLHYRRRSWGARVVHDDALLDLGPHLVDLARWLTGSEVVGVRARTVSHERAVVDVELSRGRAEVQVAADRMHREQIVVHDAAGERLAIHRAGGPLAAVVGRLQAGPHPLVTTLAAQLAAFTRSVGGTEEPDLGTATHGVAVMAAIDAARASAAGGGRPVAVAAGVGRDR